MDQHRDLGAVVQVEHGAWHGAGRASGPASGQAGHGSHAHFGGGIGQVSMLLGTAGHAASAVTLVDRGSLAVALGLFALTAFHLVVGWKLHRLSRTGSLTCVSTGQGLSWRGAGSPPQGSSPRGWHGSSTVRPAAEGHCRPPHDLAGRPRPYWYFGCWSFPSHLEESLRSS
ncbi:MULTISPECIES: hypothetical protein [unclassified Pseudofrankia]|uniref:hypothetical protein n=1 Tax=unclassified Pseudofrankia TaxID=2994372 RepID=UPI0008DA289C|nr:MULTISPECIES: hypothetical protein [unclassified Pseudofrankia]MDT3445358.1 hypothetical protein [Pseudofrankia sp. BMG5.37]OHV51329.1 hypothetical protein BCD48_10060 [Pseudofrankia sp. BMG5.36]